MAENMKRVANTVSVNDVIDQAKFTKFHLSIGWCFKKYAGVKQIHY